MEFDLHVHSRFSSDSTSDPKEIVAVARKMGLKGVAIVDHGSLDGGLIAMQYATDDFIVVPGVEVQTPLGDILGLFVHTPVEAEEPRRVIEEIKAQGGVAVLPHPYFGQFLKHPDVLKAFDAIEVCNGRHQYDGDKTLEESMMELEKIAEEYDLTPLGASDAHVYGEIGMASTIIPAETLQDLRAAILSGPTIVKHRGASKFRRLFL
jgi:hypothetical protein